MLVRALAAPCPPAIADCPSPHRRPIHAAEGEDGHAAAAVCARRLPPALQGRPQSLLVRPAHRPGPMACLLTMLQPGGHARPCVDMPLLPPAQQLAAPLQGHFRRADPPRTAPQQHHHRVPPPSASPNPTHLHLCRRHVSGGGQLEGAQGLHHHEPEPAAPVCSSRSSYLWHHGM